MNDKYKEIGAGLAVVGSIVYAFHLFMDWTGIPPDLEANFGIAVKDLFWVVSVILLIVATTRFLHCYGIAGAGADPIGTGPRDKYDALRKSLAAHEDAKDGYARRLKAFLAKVDAFFGDADLAMQRFYLLREQARYGRRRPSIAACCSHCSIRSLRFSSFGWSAARSDRRNGGWASMPPPVRSDLWPSPQLDS
jgi:hypothetical protein